jgi:hypothetical protein
VVGVTAGAGVPPQHVTVITDSAGGALSWEKTAHDILAARLDLDVETEICRRLVAPGCVDPQPESALATIQRLGPALGPTVVIDVGYNDVAAEYAAGIDPVVHALADAGVQHVIWVTLAEHQQTWVDINDSIRAAAARWPQLVVADWAPVAAANPQWFVDEAHLDSAGARALAVFVRPYVLRACGPPCDPPQVFCGLARTVNGFDAVQAEVVDCAAARATIAAIERGDRGDWVCSRSVGGTIELDCRSGEAGLQVLERSPVPAVRRASGVVRLANWLFRIRGRRLDAREDGTAAWVRLAGPPWCVPSTPREALVALALRPLTPNGGCFTRRR